MNNKYLNPDDFNSAVYLGIQEDYYAQKLNSIVNSYYGYSFSLVTTNMLNEIKEYLTSEKFKDPNLIDFNVYFSKSELTNKILRININYLGCPELAYQYSLS